MKQFAKKHPVIFCIIYFLCILVIKKLVMVPIYHSTTIPIIIENLAEFLILCVEIGITWIMVRKIDVIKYIPFKKAGLGKGMLWSIPGLFMVLLLAVCNFSTSVVLDIPLLTIFTLKNFSIGLMEELIVRGMFLGLMLLCWKEQKSGCYKAVMISSLIFGLGHLGNLLNGDINSVFSQVIYAFFLGVYFAAVTIRSNNIWPGIIVHSLIDFAGSINDLIPSNEIETAVHNEAFSLVAIVTNVGIIFTIPLFIYGVIILWRYVKKEKNNK